METPTGGAARSPSLELHDRRDVVVEIIPTRAAEAMFMNESAVDMVASDVTTSPTPWPAMKKSRALRVRRTVM